MKYVVAVAIVVALLWVLRMQRRRRPGGPPPGAADGARAAGRPVPMLRCAACGVHLAATEAVRAGDEVFCCDEHRDGSARRPR